MPVPRKRGQRPDKLKQANGLYVHSSPPRVLQLNSAHIKYLIRAGDVDKLETIVYDGQGKKLLGEHSNDYKVRVFLRNVPSLMSKISLVHDAVNSGRLDELQSLLDEENEKTRKRLILAKDEAGVGLLHKAVYYDLKDIAEWIVKNYPNTATSKDVDGRTAYHYTPMSQSSGTIQKILKAAGADPAALDNRQHSAKYYKDHISELELPSPHKSNLQSRRNTTFKESLNIKKSNIRIWIHQRDLNSLQQVIWEGHAAKLLVEHSNNPKVKKFLEAVPHIMGAIRDVHYDAINDNLDDLKEHTSPPAPNILFIAKDSNGLTPLHKAAGLGKQDIAEYIIAQNPKSLSIVDNEGRTPLHYSVLVKDGGKMFDYLVEAGADEGALDNKSKSAAFYKTRNNEIDAKVLQLIPDCPRKAKDNSHFDWAILGIAATPAEEMVKAITDDEKDNEVDAEAEGENGTTEEAEDMNNNEEAAEANGVDAEVAHEDEANGEEDAAEEEHPAESEPSPAPDSDKHEDEPPAAESPAGEEVAASNGASPEATEEEAAASPVAAEEPGEASPAPEEEPPAEEEHASPEHAEEAEAEAEIEAVAEAEAEAEAEEEADEELGLPEDVELVEVIASPVDGSPAAETTPEPAGEEAEGEGEGEEESKSEEDDKEEIEVTIVEPEGVIEGIVNGENEIESVNEQGQGATSDADDAEIAEMVESGNMEQLAGLVLNGDGDRLMGHTSEAPELQAFLDNVPVYMSKINRIHLASRDGSLKELQAALDRRKFAIAKDKVSPNGASPLHVATVFGNTSIVRYLAGRFPETVSVADDNGRTSLHYAAVVPDNGHYYNLLVHLGANTRAEDKYGHTPEFYRVNQSEFSHKILLSEYGAEEMADEMLSDKVPDDHDSARKDLDDQEMIAVLERCFTVLQGRRSSNAASAVSVSTITSISNNGSYSLLSKHTRKYVFDTVKLRLTKYDHNLYDVIWPSVKKLPTDTTFRNNLEHDFPAGIVIPDLASYKVFAELLMPVIKESNNLDCHLEVNNQPPQQFVLKEQTEKADEPEDVDIDFDLDIHAKNVLSGSLECSRNIDGYELPKSLTVGDLETVERMLTSSLLNMTTANALYPNATNEEIEEKGSGTYYTMNEILEDQSEARVILSANGLMIPLWNISDSDRLHGKHWPYGRGVFLSNSCNLAVWVNVLDHLRIITCTPSVKPGNVGQIYSRVIRLMQCLDTKLSFRRDEKLGFLGSRPTVVGNTLQFNLNVRFPHLIKEPDNLRHLCHVRGLKYHRNTQSTDIVRIGNQQCLGITELQCFEDFCTAVANILQLEKDLAMSNSLHIAALFVNMFKRKKANAADY